MMQGPFLVGRGVADNVILTQELVHTIRKSKKWLGFLLAYKIDLVKAYDRVDLEISAENIGGFWLCQVDLLSSYLLFLSMAKLSMLIDSRVVAGLWNPPLHH
ncbi:hypothetical protein NC652_027688 [Populus alba x Populus x berolinensis]|uniref:Reverse transcriptase domain-containing protein n=1 Tax=Populus alba TaxID=43335 RepID=A0A4U5Q6X0_POPAL|nr:hypothetical protein NC652_027688 [Populus alba x Populus x berolinensis]TKS04407.1 hypothetical protein D5086_0000143630 [Populus alba]